MSDIAINPVTRRVQFTGNTGTGPYAFTFNILVDGDIAVFKGTTELTLTTDYTVSINANGTGSITLTAALIASDVLTIIGGRELSRTTDFVTAGDLLASSLNEQLDSNVIMTQQLDEKLGRGLFVNPGDVFTDLELPLKDDRKGTVLGFNETTGDPEPGPTLSDVDSLATISADIKTLAEIQDGTVATDAITNVNTIRTDVTTVSGISSNVTTVAGNTSNINTVAGNNANITTVAGIDSDVTTVSGISSDVTTVAADGTDIGVVAGISSDVTTVSGVSTEIGRLGTADAVSDMNVLSAPAVIADMDSLADNVSAISIVSDDIGNVIAVAVNAANINTVAADGADIGTVAGDISNVNTVATNITSVNTNATNITDIQNASANAATATTQAGIATTQAGIATTKASEASASEVAAEAAKVAAEAALDEFTDIYLGAKASDPTTDNDGNALTAGDQYFNTTLNVLKIYNGSAWQSAAIDSSGFVETTGDTMTGNLSFGDNDKAIFGAGSDLQIYHDGSNSRIQDTATGSLILSGTNFYVNNTGDSKSYIAGLDGGTTPYVRLYYDGSTRLDTTSTGIDVTGTVTADGLTVDLTSGYARIQDLNSEVVSGTNMGGIEWRTADSSVSGANRITARIRAEGDGTFNATDKAPTKLIFSTHTTSGADPVDRMVIASNGDISFYDSQGSSQSFFWDASAESLGIGTSSPDDALHVYNTSSLNHVRIDGPAGINRNLNFSTSGTTRWNIYANSTAESGSDSGSNLTIAKYTDAGVYNGVAMFIERSSGSVGIGTSSPADPLHVYTSDAGVARLESTSANSYLRFITSADTNGYVGYESNDMVIYANNSKVATFDSSGNVGIGVTPSAWDTLPAIQVSTYGGLSAGGGYTRLSSNAYLSTYPNTWSRIATNTASLYEQGGGQHVWSTAASGSAGTAISFSEAMRIDSSGNLLVGTTDSAPGAGDTNTGVSFRAGGDGFFSKDSSYGARFNRNTNDGDVVTFAKNGTTVGSIGTYSNDVYIGNDDVGLLFNNASNYMSPHNVNTNLPTDGAMDIGAGSRRFKDLYLSGGVVFGDAGGSGTSTSNTLDSYEEGTFTPTAFGTTAAGTTTYAAQTGSYTKVGDTVHVDIYISWSAMTGTGDLRIGGLPFTSSSASNYFATGTIVPLLGFTWPSGKTQLNPIMSASDTAMNIYGSATDSNSDGAATDNEIVALAITITYKV